MADAQRAGDKETENVWNTIKTDRQKHAELLRNLVDEIKDGEF